MENNKKPNTTILIVEDEKDLLDILVEELSVLGFKILTASNGKQAYDMICNANANVPIDAILSDINMPEMNGLEMLRAIRKKGKEIPFIFLTGYGDKEKAIAALKFGAMDFLEKPFDKDNLINSVRKAAEYGVQVRELEIELETIIKKLNVPIEKQDAFKVAQKSVLLLKKQNKIYK